MMLFVFIGPSRDRDILCDGQSCRFNMLQKIVDNFLMHGKPLYKQIHYIQLHYLFLCLNENF